jgi:hypothetical protein
MLLMSYCYYYVRWVAWEASSLATLLLSPSIIMSNAQTTKENN